MFRPNWTPKKCTKIEGELMEIIQKVQGVTQIRRHSLVSAREYKISFLYGGDIYILSFIPDGVGINLKMNHGSFLELYAADFKIDFSRFLVEAISKIFPQAVSEEVHGQLVKTSRYWYLITEEMLVEAAK